MQISQYSGAGSSEIKGDGSGAGSSCNAARRLKVPKVRLQRQQQFPMAPEPLFGTGFGPIGTGVGSGVGTGVATPAKMATDQIGRQAGGQAGRQAQAGRAIP